MSSVLGKNGWWEEAEPSRENSRVLPGLNEGHVWLPLVWFVRFLFAMCLACVLSASPQTLISCMDPWPFSVAVGVCHLIVTRTNTRRHRFLWYYWPVGWFQWENNHSVPALKTNPGATYCTLSMTVAHIQVSFHGQTQGDMQNNTFTRDKFCSVSDVRPLLAVLPKTMRKENLNRILRWVSWMSFPPLPPSPQGCS